MVRSYETIFNMQFKTCILRSFFKEINYILTLRNRKWMDSRNWIEAVGLAGVKKCITIYSDFQVKLSCEGSLIPLPTYIKNSTDHKITIAKHFKFYVTKTCLEMVSRYYLMKCISNLKFNSMGIHLLVVMLIWKYAPACYVLWLYPSGSRSHL